MNIEQWAIGQLNKVEVSEEKKKQYENILNAFGEQGHSGFSAGYALRYINLFIEKGYDEVKSRLDSMLTGDCDEGMQNTMAKDIFEIINMIQEYGFGKEEAHNLSRLMDWKPIILLTGEDDEWGTPQDYDGKNTQQNKVCSAVFRDNFDNTTAHYLYGRVYSDNGGHTWFTGNHGNGIVQSHTPVTFPFWVPDKSEYIYLNGEDSEEIITDKVRIKELYDEWEKRFSDNA